MTYETERVRVEPHESIRRVYTVWDKSRANTSFGTAGWHKHWGEVCFYPLSPQRLIPLSAFRDIADFMDKLKEDEGNGAPI